MIFNIRVLRALDGMLVSLLSVVVLLLLLKAGVITPGGHSWDLLLLAPVALAGLLTFAIPATPPPRPKWVRHRQWLCAFALAWLLLAPFMVWYNVAPTNSYLILNLFAALVAAVGWLSNLNELTVDLAEAYGDAPLAMEGRINRYLLLFLFLVVVALGFDLYITNSPSQPPPFDNLRILLMSLGRWGFAVLLLPTLPILLTMSLLLRVRFVVARQLRYELHEADNRARVTADGDGTTIILESGATVVVPHQPPPLPGSSATPESTP